MMTDILKQIQTKFDGNFASKATFDWVYKYVRDHEIVQKTNSKMILSLYPDCLSEKMREDDPRKNYLDKEKMNKLAQYGFPIGYRPIRSKKRPPNELIPNCFSAGDEKTYM